MSDSATVTAFRKLRTKDDIEIFVFSEYQPQKGLWIKILDVRNNEAFSGTMSDFEMRTVSANIRMTHNAYLDDIFKALLNRITSEVEYVYTLDGNNNSSTFQWGKSINSGEIMINLGKLTLNKIDFSVTTSEVLSLLSGQLIKLNEMMENLNSSFKDTESRCKDAVNLLSSVSDMKVNLEKELYSKFILVLNKKKQKIVELKGTANENVTLDVENDTRQELSLHESSDDIDGDIAVPSTSHKRHAAPLSDSDGTDSDISLYRSKMRRNNDDDDDMQVDNDRGIKTENRSLESDDDSF